MKNCPAALSAILVGLALPNASDADVIINEIFYHGPADLERLEFVELHNTSAQPVDLSGWTFSKGIDYTFPADSKITANGFLVICGDKDLFTEFFSEAEAFGVYTKTLDNGGETLTLENADGKKADSVKYDDKAPWPMSPDGYSASLERICPSVSGKKATNWAPSLLSDDYDRKASGTPGRQNSTYAATLPPVIQDLTVASEIVNPDEPITVQATINDAVTKVELLHRTVSPGSEGEESSIAMKRGEGNSFNATIPGTESNRIIRFRVRATNDQGDARHFPHQHAVRPTLSVYVSDEAAPSAIPIGHVFNVGQEEFQRGTAYRTGHAQSRSRSFGNRGRPRETEADRLRRETKARLSDTTLEKAWTEVTFKQPLEADKLLSTTKAFLQAKQTLSKLRNAIDDAEDIQAFSKQLESKLTTLRETLQEAIPLDLTEAQSEIFSKIGVPEERGRRFGGRAELVKRFFNIEGSWFRAATGGELTPDQLGNLARTHRDAVSKRAEVAEKFSAGGDVDFTEVMEEMAAMNGDLGDAVGKILKHEQLGDPFSPFRGRRGPRGFGESQEGPPLRPQGRSAFIYTDPKTKKSQLFDFVNITQRKSGYKVRLHKDKPLNGLTTINVLYERNEPSTLNEALAYELYRYAGNATAEAGFLRLLIDGELAGYHVWFEQPNGNFFRRHDIDDRGNLYKLIWMGSHRPSKYTPKEKIPDRMDIVGKHEKKTDPHDGYDDIVELIETLEEANGDDAKMWQLIEQHFEVDQVINYFAVNALLSHWDGFFNNYFLYHDVKGSEKWTMYPWDQDSTWSQRMGNPQELSTMPLNYGAEGARPAGAPPREERPERSRRGFRGFGGGRGAPGWWRDGGDISRPLLANPEFAKRYRARLKELAETVFNEDVFGPKIEAVRSNIAPEVKLRAETLKQDPDSALQTFERTMDAFHEHLKLRREWLLKELEKEES